MKYIPFLLIFISFLSCQSNHKQGVTENTWTPLWNGRDFTGWHSYLAVPYKGLTIDSIRGLVIDNIGDTTKPFGIDYDPLEIIKVVETDQGSVIRITGVAWGMLYTEKEYKNYHLKLKVKWGEDIHPPKGTYPRNSGLLYHGFGEPGSAYYFMNSHEFQMANGHMGDFWTIGDVEIDAPSVPSSENKYYIFKKDAELRTYYHAHIYKESFLDSAAKWRVIKATDAEKPLGEWNDVELIAFGDSSIHIVNGKVVMRLFNSRKMSNKTPLNSGKIILQSEGAEIYYKDLYIKPLVEIPVEFK